MARRCACGPRHPVRAASCASGGGGHRFAEPVPGYPVISATSAPRAEARAEAWQDRQLLGATAAAPPTQLGVVPAPKVAISASAPVLHIEGQGPDGRVHAVITPGG